LKEKLEDYKKLKVELDHTNKEIMLTLEKLKKIGRSTEKIDGILCNTTRKRPSSGGFCRSPYKNSPKIHL
jgi:hypothetical protein